MESVNFTLKTTDILDDITPVTIYYNQTYNSNFGSIGENRTSITWNNVNFKTILGELYERYEKFNISLNFIAGSETGTLAETSTDFRTFYVKMKGLNFTSTYDQLTQNNCGAVVLTTLQIPLTASTAWVSNYFTQQYFTFSKAETSIIKIDLLNIADNGYYFSDTVDEMIGHLIFSFNITGCDDYKNVKNNANTNIDLDLRKIF